MTLSRVEEITSAIFSPLRDHMGVAMPEESLTELLGASSYEIGPTDAAYAMARNLPPGAWLPAGSCLGFSPSAQGTQRAVYTRQSGHIVAVRYRTETGRMTVFVAQRHLSR
jgi:hypothetical protein